MIVAEVEPFGGFVAESISEPLLQTGILLSVLAYITGLLHGILIRINAPLRRGAGSLLLKCQPSLSLVFLLQEDTGERDREARVNV
jgi:hypothetical protein